MKASWKLGLSLVAAAVLMVTFFTTSSEPAGAVLTCPPNHCPEVLDGYTYLGPCVGGPGGPCVGWSYRKGGETCHVAALTGS
ncbi:MAG: hypothetical protein AAF657_35325 [Acidobacteriota bacterium]